ncbi:DNA packaging tegument protein UL25 [Saimiriine betaherpesvirus 4]|uniref:DNA packaging tegument protein UL25 n=1 Tax=Saimiriine betaherpesvirus 4 TaxID=1535247 RepID=G8XSY2_9BETA|nr:DNA packaging tegument protein UL25 [Saimiriine betaherpesvirus 4]AEV80928.1 DNA packaging tegument protein UL25 [Saimiriine betaherpesvirus 4]
MNRLETFYHLPVPKIALGPVPVAVPVSVVAAFEPHVDNVLWAPERVLRRLRDATGIELRQRRDEAVIDRIKKRYLKEELRQFRDAVANQCLGLEGRLSEAEMLLRQQVTDLPVSSSPRSSPVRIEGEAAPSEGAVDLGKGQKTGAVTWAAFCHDDRHALHVGITQNDPTICFHRDFRGELIGTMFENSSTWTFSFGVWYYRLKRSLYTQPRWKRVFRLMQMESFSISQELLVATVGALENVTVYPAYDCALSDLEAAACLLAAYGHQVWEGRDAPDSVIGVLQNLPYILNRLSEEIHREMANWKESVTTNFYSYQDSPDMRYYVPMSGGRRYASGTFGRHILVRIFTHRNVLQRLAGSEAQVSAVVQERISGQAVDESTLTMWTRKLLSHRLGREVPIFLHEQQYLRSGLTCIETLLLLWKIVNSESVFVSRKRRFSLTDIIGSDLGAPKATVDPGYTGSNVRNFEYLVEQYIIPWYQWDPTVTASQLFPGVVLLAITESVRSGWDPLQREDVKTMDGGAITVQATKINPIADFMFAQSSKQYSALKRLELHDTLLFHYENGVGKVLSVSLPRHRVFCLGSSLFNVNDIYECIYFFVLGFLPAVAVT